VAEEEIAFKTSEVIIAEMVIVVVLWFMTPRKVARVTIFRRKMLVSS
jgi:hypothetical protein